MPTDTIEMPDLLVLDSLDETGIETLRVRLEQAGDRLEQLDPERSTGFSWPGRDSKGASIGRSGDGTSLSIYGSYDVLGFVLADRTLPFPTNVTSSSPLSGISAARLLLDRFAALLDLPRIRVEQLRLPRMLYSGPSEEKYPLARSYVAALELMVARCAALYAQWGRPEARPEELGIVPPRPRRGGDLIDTRTGHSVLSGLGVVALSAGVPRVLHLSNSLQHGYVLTSPDRWSLARPFTDPDPIEIMRLLQTEALSAADATLLARRLRRVVRQRPAGIGAATT